MADHDIEVRALEPGLWAADPKPGLMLPGGRAHWGGYVLGLLMKAILSEPHSDAAPISMTVSYMAALKDAPMTISTRLLRRGSTLEFWRAEVAQDDGLAAHAQITLGHRRPTQRFSWMQAPQAPPPETLPVSSPAASFLREYELRNVGHFPSKDGGSRSLGWARLVDARPLDHVLLAMAADRFPPRHSAHYGWPGPPASTISLTIYFHATPQEIAEVQGDFVLCQAEGRRGSDSIFDMHASIWRRDGLLLITTEQLSWLREPPASS